MKRIAIVQSNYVPWKGYFDLIGLVDEFVLYDEVQYTRRDWRNRNMIKTPAGLAWLTIPVTVKGKYFQRIDETRISDPNWARQHWATLRHNYAKAPFFHAYRDLLEDLYLGCREDLLSRVNYRFLSAITGVLNIGTRLSWSSAYGATETGDKTDRLVEVCEALGGTVYLSGPAAKSYLDESKFAARGIDVAYMDYSGYREYSQLHAPFEHGVSILDLLLNTGPDAGSYMKYSRPA
ncbi:MAG: WbqC family protein [Gammaproteobacteria bacterium]|nr:WbqC family protein [Gammaproteobacteria bacterium]MBI5616595.1 WbqC family protein [Gammaproteobacteria bacterium]